MRIPDFVKQLTLVLAGFAVWCAGFALAQVTVGGVNPACLLVQVRAYLADLVAGPTDSSDRRVRVSIRRAPDCPNPHSNYGERRSTWDGRWAVSAANTPTREVFGRHTIHPHPWGTV